MMEVIRGEMGTYRIPTSFDKVYKDECVMSFDSPYSEGGLYVNLKSWLGYGKDHVRQDSQRSGTKVYLHQQWKQVLNEEPQLAEAEKLPTSLVVDGSNNAFDETKKYDTVKVNSLCVLGENGEFTSIPLPSTELPEFVNNVVDAIIKHDGMQAKMAEEVWSADSMIFESKYARELKQLDNGKKINPDPSTWKCEMSGDTENLWLNLSTGYIGGGRKNWDGSGGSGAALQHFEDLNRDTGSMYPLCVKLGTITAHGADVWSYAPDEDTLVKDPLLAEHLSHWGIDIMKLEKTAKTMGELEVDLNMKYDWAASMEGGAALEKLYGAGWVGLRNLGSSCYLNSVVQCVLNLPQVQDRYLTQRDAILRSPPTEPQADFVVQFSKLAQGVLTDAYVEPEAERERKDSRGNAIPKQERYVVTPRMFKHTVGKGHQDFSGGKQQDAAEYFQFLLAFADREERVGLARIAAANPNININKASMNDLFKYHLQDKLVCTVTNQVKMQPVAEETMLTLTFPEDIVADACARKAATATATATATAPAADGSTETKRAKVEEEPKQTVPLATLLARYFGDETMQYKNPTLGGQEVPTIKNARFRSFPPYLMLQLARGAQTPDWRQVKVENPVSLPDTIDLTSFARDGLSTTDVEMPDEAGAGAGAGFEINEELVGTLVSMGFSNNAAKRAAISTDNAPLGPEQAMDWLMQHMEDADFNDDPATLLAAKQGEGGAAAGGSGDDGVTAAGMEALSVYGFTELQCRCALRATGGDVERAMDWIFSHEGQDLEAAADEATNGAKTNGPPECGQAGNGTYELMAMVSHIGPNLDHGHYVCHVKKGGKWALFDDDRVAHSPVPPIDKAYLVMYARVQK